MTDQDLATSARLIQLRRRWTHVRCAELSGLKLWTWKEVVVWWLRKSITAATRAALQTFVDTYRNDAKKPPPPPVKYNRGYNHHLTKRTPELDRMVVESNKTGVQLARELGLCSATITRIRQAHQWATNVSLESDRELVERAYAVQLAHRLSTKQMAQASGVPESTWKRRLSNRAYYRMSHPNRVKLQAFIARWSEEKAA